VQDKLYGLWSDARQRLYGEDYWIPSDAYEVAVFPNEYLKNHKVVYPTADSKENILDTSLSVVQCTRKKEQPEMIILNHVVYDRSGLVMESLSLFRAEDLNEAMDFCRRCEECRALFKLIGEFSSDIPGIFLRGLKERGLY
jgi:hypothetical protein